MLEITIKEREREKNEQSKKISKFPCLNWFRFVYNYKYIRGEKTEEIYEPEPLYKFSSIIFIIIG